MDVRVAPSAISGTVRAPGSKSYTHRAILCAGLADGATVSDPLRSADTEATSRAVEAFGGAVTEDGEDLAVTGVDGVPGVPDDVIDCGNSGTTMRLVIGTAALVDGVTVLTGDASLRERPQGPLLAAIDALGGTAESTRGNGAAPVIVRGPSRGGDVAIPGDVSSQYISSLLLAGALTPDGIEITLTTPLKSAPYVDVTLEVLEGFGVTASRSPQGYRVDGEQRYRRDDPYAVPGDFSSISYLVGAGVLAGDPVVEVGGARPSAQGDTAIVSILERMGGDVAWDRTAGELSAGRSDLAGITVDVGDTPDLLPTIAALGAVANGTTHITNAEHVRYKETDRVAAMAAELDRLGANIEEETDALTVHGGDSELVGGTVDGYGDHRIVMALALLGLVAPEGVTVRGAEHVDVSFPGFFAELERMGARVDRSE